MKSIVLAALIGAAPQVHNDGLRFQPHRHATARVKPELWSFDTRWQYYHRRYLEYKARFDLEDRVISALDYAIECKNQAHRDHSWESSAITEAARLKADYRAKWDDAQKDALAIEADYKAKVAMKKVLP